MEIRWFGDSQVPGWYLQTDAKLNVWSGPHEIKTLLLIRALERAGRL